MIYHGDSLEVLKGIPDNYFHSVCTDPPYGLAFMGKKWDYDVPSVELWKEVLRVLKPGGHLLSFGGTRTYHRMVLNIEDAGFEVRDQLQWIYGSGFPKSMDISKAIDKAAGARGHDAKGFNTAGGELPSNGGSKFRSDHPEYVKPEAITDLAKQWQGWGTALKPANEPICMARKPLIGTVVQNIEAHGVGGLNIDGSRIETSDVLSFGSREIGDGTKYSPMPKEKQTPGIQNPQGRWPANILFDEEAAAMLDEQSGVSKSGAGTGLTPTKARSNMNASIAGINRVGHSDSGGASRFFYVAKSSKSERNAGVEGVITWEGQDQSLQDLMVELSSHLKDMSDDTMQTLKGIVWNTTSSGSASGDQSLLAFKFTIETVTKLITELKTSNCCPLLITKESTLGALRMIAESGLSPAESAARLEALRADTISEKMESALGANLALLQTLSKINALGKNGNVHSTVKPIKLMEYLVRMVTPPGGIVLDPFAGSGSTGVACAKLGFGFVGIEREKEYVEIARKRGGFDIPA